jgi:hypothetical protein
MNHKRLALFVAGALGITGPLLAEDGNKKLIVVTNTQEVPFRAGGTIHLNHSYGDLSVEGWDRPEVEITVIKTPDDLYDAKHEAEATKRAERVKVTAERRSDTDLEISTAVLHHSRWPRPFSPKGGVNMAYRIQVPRNSKLVIHHGAGAVVITNVTSDIEATGHSGDIVLLLPQTERCSIDAKTRVGTVSSDFEGTFKRRRLTGRQYFLTGTAPAHHILLRMGVGGITIKELPAAAEPRAATRLQ